MSKSAQKGRQSKNNTSDSSKAPTRPNCIMCDSVIMNPNRTKYCSSKCNTQYQKLKRKLTELQKVRVKMLKERSCEYCGWKETTCDIHHITPISEGGTNHSTNLITLCPNHHRLADYNLLSRKSLSGLVEMRKKEIGF